MTIFDQEELSEALKPITANMAFQAKVGGCYVITPENLAHGLTEAFVRGVKYGQDHPEVDAT